MTGIKALRSDVETVMDPRSEQASLEQLEREAVGDEVTDRIHGALIYLYAVGTTDDGFCPQFVGYVEEQLTRLFHEISAYRRMLAMKRQREQRRAKLIKRRARINALLKPILEEAKPLLRMKARVDKELLALNEEERRIRFPYLKE